VHELEVSTAESWHTAAFLRIKRLQPLRTYLRDLRPRPPAAPLPPAERQAVVDAAKRWKDELTRRKRARKTKGAS